MNASPRILQFGTTGQLGTELIRFAKRDGVAIRAVTLEEADFTKPEDVARIVAETPDIDVVINAAAYTAVDRAESEEALAATINAQTVGVLAYACAARNIRLIHVSTDYVYDGEKNAPYIETDVTNPLGAYGRTKLAGEHAIRDSGVSHVILRTSWVYSPFGTNFVKTMLRLGAEREELRVVADQYGAPTAAGDLADTILSIAMHLRNGAANTEKFGIFHYAGEGTTTWCDFAQVIIDSARDWAGVYARVTPISTDEYPTPAKRPRNSRLNCAKIQNIYGICPKPWRGSVNQVLSELKSKAVAMP